MIMTFFTQENTLTPLTERVDIQSSYRHINCTC